MKNFNFQKGIILIIVISVAFIATTLSSKVNAAITNQIAFQSKIINKTTGLNITSGTPPACVLSSADTCDFRVRIWNLSSGGTATAGNNLLFEELFNNVELGDTNGIFTLLLNSVCQSTASGSHSWSVAVGGPTICNIFDDNADADSTVGINFDRADLYLELTFDPSGAWTSLASPPGGIEVFARTNLNSVPTAFMTTLVGGLDETGYVQLSPTSEQATSSSTGAVRVNQQGSGDILKFQTDVSNTFTLTNAGQLQLSSASNGYAYTRVVTGPSAFSEGFAVDADTNGIYTTGEFQNTEDFDGTAGTDNKSALSQDIFISKNNADGTYGWTRTIGKAAMTSNGFGIAGDNVSAVYAVGDFDGTTVDFDGTAGTDNKSTNGGQDIFIAKYNSDGSYAWTRTFGGTTDDIALGVAATSSAVYVTGTFTGSNVDFDATGGTDLKTSNGGTDIFITKYNSDGSYGWTRTVGGASADSGNSVAIDTTTGNVYGVGSFQGATVDFDGTAGTDNKSSAGGSDIFITRYASAGTYISTSIIGSSSTDTALGISFDSNSNYYLTGIFGGTVDFDTTAGTDNKVAISQDSFITKYSILGTYGWTRTAGGTSVTTFSRGISANPGGVYIIGDLSGVGTISVDFDGTAGTDNFTGSAFGFYTTGYNADGSYLWTKILQNFSGSNNGYGVKAYNKRVYSIGMFGEFGVAMDFDTGTGVDSFTPSFGNVFLTVYYQDEGIRIGGDTNIYRSATSSLKTDDNLIVGTNLTVNGLSNFKGNLKSVLTVSNGSTTTSGTGTSTKSLTVTSATNFDVGNLVLINGTTYAVIESKSAIDQTLFVNPAVTWTAGQTVVEYTAPKIGGDGTDPSLMMDRLSANNGLRVGSSTSSTNYQDQLLSTSTTSNLEINTPKAEVNTIGNAIVNTTRGLYINKSETLNTTQTWSTDNVAVGAVLRSGNSAVNYNGKAYVFGGQSGPSVLATMYSYEYATDTWRFVGNGTARTQHAAVVYNDKMYVWGGYDATPTVVNTMDVYNFVTGTWSAGTAGGTARAEPSAVVYKDKMYIWGTSGASFDVYDFSANSWSTLTTTGGAAPNGTSITVYNDKIFMVGGDGSSYNKIYSFDFRTNAWTTLSNSPVERAGHTIAIYDNKLYAFGGFTSTSTLLNTVSIYDFATDSWSSGVTGGTAKKYSFLTTYNGKAYIFFGESGGGPVGTVDIYDFGVSDIVLKISAGDQDKLTFDQNNVLALGNQALGLKYVTNDSADYSNAAWGSGAAGGTARQYGVSVEYNGKIYNWGGANQALATLFNTMDIYDIKSNTWSTGTAGGTAKWGATGIAYNGKIYIFQGCTTTGGSCGTVTNVVEIYDIAANSWSTGTAGGTARGIGVVVQANGKVYSWGGFTGAANLNTLDIYDIAANSWSTGTAGGTARRLLSGVVYKNKIYVYGGFVAAVSNVLDIYDIQTNSWQAGTAGPTAKRSFSMVAYRDRIYVMHAFTTVGVNTVDIYNIERGTWATGLSGGNTNYAAMTTFYGNKAYLWAGSNTGSTALVNTLDILDFGSPKAEDILTIGGNLGSGQDDGKLFRFDSTGRAYTSEQGGWFSVGADYAEYMHTSDKSILPGDIVKLDPQDGKSVLKAKAGDEFIGVISTNPGFVGNITSIADINNGRDDMKLLSMVGQVPVRVTGNIQTGDKITISEIDGVGKKANEGDDTLGIAQEAHSGNSIDMISVLITRNNEGINNKVQIKLGKEGSQGFRLSSEGKLQIKDDGSEWTDISKQLSIDNSVIWKKIGDNVYTNNTGKTSIGINEDQLSDSRLQVGGDIEIKDGLKFIKVSASTQSIKLGSEDVGFRLNNSKLELRDEQTGVWKSLSGLVLSNLKVNPDGTSQQVFNQEQVSGWGYLKGDGLGTSLSRILSFGKTFTSVPVVIVDVIGSNSIEPENLADCKYDSNIVTITPSSIDSTKFNLNVKTETNTETSKYYCYSWRALGN